MQQTTSCNDYLIVPIQFMQVALLGKERTIIELPLTFGKNYGARQDTITNAIIKIFYIQFSTLKIMIRKSGSKKDFNKVEEKLYFK